MARISGERQGKQPCSSSGGSGSRLAGARTQQVLHMKLAAQAARHVQLRSPQAAAHVALLARPRTCRAAAILALLLLFFLIGGGIHFLHLHQPKNKQAKNECKPRH